MADAAPLPILPESPCGCGTVAQPLRACERERYCWKEKFASSPQILRKRRKCSPGLHRILLRQRTTARVPNGRGLPCGAGGLRLGFLRSAPGSRRRLSVPAGDFATADTANDPCGGLHRPGVPGVASTGPSVSTCGRGPGLWWGQGGRGASDRSQEPRMALCGGP